jgi:outer membrane protein TolC
MKFVLRKWCHAFAVHGVGVGVFVCLLLATANVLGQGPDSPQAAKPRLGVSAELTEWMVQEARPANAKSPPEKIEILPPPQMDRLFGESPVYPITLTTALRMSLTSDLDIAQAREFVNVVGAQLTKANVLWMPNVNLGSQYTQHEGNIAKTEGNIIKANKDALFAGGGPSLTMSFADALFTPLVAQQVSAASRAALQRVNQDTLLAVTDAYEAVLRARRRLARVDAVLEFLTANVPAPSRSDSKGLLPVVEVMEKAGAAEVIKAEVYRVQVEVLRRREERAAALQEFRVANAELARLLRLDPQLVLWPIEDFRKPLDISGPWYGQPVDELVLVALNNRPELAENQALVQAAVERVRLARYRPLMPNLIVNYSYGGYGGSPDPNPNVIVAGKSVPQPGFGPSGSILHFGNRSDFDVALVWTFKNMGMGNRAEIREQEAQMRQVALRRAQVEERVVAQVVQADELLRGWEERMRFTRSALFDSAGKPAGPVFESLRLNFDRIRRVEKTRPLEVLDSIRGLNDTLEAYGQAVTDYERSRIRLLIVLGLPPEEILARLTAAEGASKDSEPGRE